MPCLHEPVTGGIRVSVRMQLLNKNFCMLALLAWLIVPPVDSNASESSIGTRYGPVKAALENKAEAEYSNIWFRGKLVARLEGDASMYKLSLPHVSDFVLVDASQPGLNCRDEFVLIELTTNNAKASSRFGQCMSLFGARILNGKPVVQLIDNVEAPQGIKFVHEFVLADGQITESGPKLIPCRALALSAMPGEDSKTLLRSVTGKGRAYLYSAPDDECLTASFIVPGDIVTIRRELDDYASVVYRNKRTGQIYNGWVKRARLADVVDR